MANDRKAIPRCEPGCWNMHTYIYPQKLQSFVGVHIPAPWFASGYCFTIAFLSLPSGKHTKNY